MSQSHPGHVLQIGSVLQCRRQNLHHDGKTIPLVSSAFFSPASQRQEARLSPDHALQNGSGAGKRLSRLAYDEPFRNAQVESIVKFNRAALDNRGSRIEKKGKLKIRRGREGNGVCPQHGLSAKSGANGRAGIGHGHTHHSPFGSHKGKIAGEAEVARVPDSDSPYSRLRSLFHGDFHCLCRHDLTHSRSPVEERRSRGIGNCRERRFGILLSRAQTIHVDRETSDSMGIDPAKVCLQQHVRCDPCILHGKSERNEY
jgi:hypothetical protein